MPVATRRARRAAARAVATVRAATMPAATSAGSRRNPLVSTTSFSLDPLSRSMIVLLRIIFLIRFNEGVYLLRNFMIDCMEKPNNLPSYSSVALHTLQSDQTPLLTRENGFIHIR